MSLRTALLTFSFRALHDADGLIAGPFDPLLYHF